MAPYIDLPIQHISEKVLKGMKRRGDKKAVMKAIELIDKYLPKRYFTVRTELITGFPEENEKEFKELVEFVNKDKIFKRITLFRYYHEEGTSAYKIYRKLPEKIIKERFNLLNRIICEKNNKSAKELIGRGVLFIPEFSKGGRVYGHTEYDAPEIDIPSFIENKNDLKIEKSKIKELKKEGFELCGNEEKF